MTECCGFFFSLKVFEKLKSVQQENPTKTNFKVTLFCYVNVWCHSALQVFVKHQVLIFTYAWNNFLLCLSVLSAAVAVTGKSAGLCGCSWPFWNVSSAYFLLSHSQIVIACRIFEGSSGGGDTWEMLKQHFCSEECVATQHKLFNLFILKVFRAS